MTQKNKEIGAAAGTLASLLEAGLPLGEAILRLEEMQPKHAEMWSEIAAQVANGIRLSVALKGYWTDGFIAAVSSGEESGKMAEVLAQIEATVNLESSLRSEVMRLAYPVGMIIGGICVFLFFMGSVIPNLMRSMKSQSHSAIMNLSLWMESMIQQHGLMLLIALLGGLFLIFAWLKTPDGRESLLTFLLDIPLIGKALNDLSFALWAQYMALMTKSGVDTIRSFESTASVLPKALQPAIVAIHGDLKRNRSLTDSVDPKKLRAGDPRERLPFYISTAITVANDTGDIAAALVKVSPSLIKEGVGSLNLALSIANMVGIGVAAGAILGPMGAYYVELFSNIKM